MMSGNCKNCGVNLHQYHKRGCVGVLENSYLTYGSDSMYEAFIQTYIRENHLDPHAIFAERTGLSRNEAKIEAYNYLYKSDFVRAVIQSNE